MAEYIETVTGDEVWEWELEERFSEWLDEAFGDVEIAGMSYETGAALKAVDPTAFRVAFLDWIDSEMMDGNLVEVES